MQTIAIVTGASRGVGRGIAQGLGEVGATVYVTGRTTVEGQGAVPLAGTVGKTAADVATLGGQGIAIACDHRDDRQVAALFERVQTEQKRLDVLVNSAWAGYEGYVTGKHFAPDHPFWDKPISFWDDNLDGLRWTYVASVHAAKQMTAQGHGLIVNVSFGMLSAGNVAYNVAKSATDRLTNEMAHQLRDHNVAVISIYPGLVRTEVVMFNAQYFDLSQSESPRFSGRAVAALAADPQIMRKAGNPSLSPISPANTTLRTWCAKASHSPGASPLPFAPKKLMPPRRVGKSSRRSICSLRLLYDFFSTASGGASPG